MYKGLKVLIIEDRRENIVFLANNILKPKGFDIITAMDGKSGLRKALEEKPDLIITDLNLPKMHGLEVLADLQDRGCAIPAIVMTFQGSEETAIKAFRMGAKDYLIKPFDIDDIENALARIFPAKKADADQGVLPINRETEAHIKMLEQQVAELQAIVKEQSPTSAADEALITNLKTKIAEQQALLSKLQQERIKLNELLNQQKKLTTEARSRARSMAQFIQLQQKEILQQNQDAARLKKQLKLLTDSFANFATRLEAQARQFKISSPQ